MVGLRSLCRNFLPLLLLLLLGVATASSDTAVRCERIVTLSPSVTELVVSLGLEEKLVGVSTYDREVAERGSLPTVGNLFQVNIEAILSLKPDLVVLLDEQRGARKKLSSLSLRTLVLDHRTVSSIHESIVELSSVCGRTSTGKKLIRRIEDQVGEIQRKSLSHNSSKPRVLIVIGDGGAGQQVKKLFISGKDGFFFELLQKLKIEPIYKEETKGLSSLSLESLILLQPTKILHILPPGSPLLSERAKEEIWSEFGMIPAVKNKEIYSRSERFFSIPGVDYPRVMAAFYEMFLLENEKS